MLIFTFDKDKKYCSKHNAQQEKLKEEISEGHSKPRMQHHQSTK